MKKHEDEVINKIILIGLRIKGKRKENGLTIFNLATDSGCSTSIIADIERGASKGITVRTVVKIATALEITPDELFCE